MRVRDPEGGRSASPSPSWWPISTPGSSSKQKFPERIEIVSEFPMTPSGKIQKYRLRQIIKEKLEAETAARPTEACRSGSP